MPVHMSFQIMSFTHNANENNQQTAQTVRESVSKGHYLSPIMIEQTNNNTCSLNINRNFQWNKKQFESWMKAIGKVVQISGQNQYTHLFQIKRVSTLTGNRLK